MAERRIGIILNGVTGRMGTNQHLVRSILAIRKEGGVPIPGDDRIMPEPVLVGRNEKKLARLSNDYNIPSYTTDLELALSEKKNRIYFDSTLTEIRVEGVTAALDAGKAVYCEKPIATTTAAGLQLARKAREAGLKNGVVQDKLWLPGLQKVKYLIDTDFFGQVLSVRGEFGYWVFDGKNQATQRPSWNYRKEDGGGIMMDMFCHWRYVIDNIFGEIESLCSIGATHIPQRVDENGEEYRCTADDAAYALFRLKNGIICSFNSSWAVRVRRDDLLTLQVDGTRGSAVAGLRECRVQHDAETPKPVWNPDIPSPIDFYENWQKVPTRDPFDNAFKEQWKFFLKHVAVDTPFPWDLYEGVKGVQLAELGIESWKQEKWIKVPPLTL